MVWINREKQLVQIKLAFAGLPGAGAIESARHLAATTPATNRTEPELTRAGGIDRLSFTFQPPGLGTMNGMEFVFHVIACDSPDPSARPIDAVDANVDGIVFCADARPISWLLQNQLAFGALRDRMVAAGRAWERMPVVVQVNRDPTGGALEDLREVLGEPRVLVEAHPSTGHGVLGAVKQIVKETILAYRDGALVQFTPQR